MYCMKCGASNDDSARFCIKCGTTLVQVKAALPQPPPQAVRPVVYQPPPARPERRRRVSRWLAIVGAALLALLLLFGALLVGAYFWLGFHRTNQTAKIVPASSPLMISLSPDPRQALHYREVENLKALLPLFDTLPDLREASEATLSDLEAELDIDFRKDLLPWLGAEVSVAMMDADWSGYAEVRPTILAVATRSEKRSDAFLEKVWQAMEREGVEFEEEIYQGIRVTYQVAEYDGAFAPAFATFNHLVVVGTNREALHRLIDTASSSGAEALAEQERFKTMLDQLPSNRLGYVYVDGEALLHDLEDETDFPIEFTAVRAAAASLGLVTGGVRIDHVESYDPDLLGDGKQGAGKGGTAECKTAEFMPAEAAAYWSGRDPSLVWFAADYLIELSEAYDYFDDTGTTLDERAETMAEATGIDVRDDLLAQIAGEWGIAVLSDPTGLLGEDAVPFGAILFAEIEDPRELEDTLQGLVQVMEFEGASVERTMIGGVPCTILEDDWEGWVFGYAFMDDLLVVGTSEAMLVAAIEGKDDPLAEGENFRAVLEELPDRAGSYLFVDVFQGSRLLYEAMDPWSRETLSEAQPYLASIQAIGVEASPADKNGMAQGMLFLYAGAGR